MTPQPRKGFFHAHRKEAAFANPIHKTKHGYYVASFASGGDFLFDEIDHINGDKLDNRRRNLRLCTHQQNAFNQKRRRTNTSGYIGVSYARGRGCFEAYIHHHGRKHHLGLFPDALLAARTRDCVARLLFGEYARLNFPKGGGRHGPR